MSADEARPHAPVDYVVIAFPEGVHCFPGMLAAELASLIENGIITVLDVLIVEKDRTGNIQVHEMGDVDAVRELEQVRMQITEVLPRDDVQHLAATVESGKWAGIVVWENTWADPLAVSVKRSECRVVSSRRMS